MYYSGNCSYEMPFRGFPDVLTVSQISHMLNINEKQAYKLVRERKIGHFKVGRSYKIPKVAVINYLYAAAEAVDSHPCQF